MLFLKENMSSNRAIRSALKELHTPPHASRGCLHTNSRHTALQLGLNISPQLMSAEQSFDRSSTETTRACKPFCVISTAPERLTALEELQPLSPSVQIQHHCWGTRLWEDDLAIITRTGETSYNAPELSSSQLRSLEASWEPNWTICSFYIQLSAVAALSKAVALGGVRMSCLDTKG